MGQLEVACFNATSALRAAAAGVHRIELCSGRASGGVTPPLPLVEELRSQIPGGIPMNVMIRPRGGHFVYSKVELEEMVSSITNLKPHCNGFVFGILKADSTVDVQACAGLVKIAEPLPCTFHRAFDEACAASQSRKGAMLQALEDVTSCGFKTVLTSGGSGNAIDNIDALRKLLLATGHVPSSMDPAAKPTGAIKHTAAGGMVIMAGGGLRKESIENLQRCGLRPEWYHTSAIIDDGELADEHELTACKIQVEKDQY